MGVKCIRQSIKCLKIECDMFTCEWLDTFADAKKRLSRIGNDSAVKQKKMKRKVLTAKNQCVEVRAMHRKTMLFMEKFTTIHRVEMAHIKNMIVSRLKKRAKMKVKQKKKRMEEMIAYIDNQRRMTIDLPIQRERKTDGNHKIYLKLLHAQKNIKQKKEFVADINDKRQRSLLKVKISEMEAVLKNMYH